MWSPHPLHSLINNSHSLSLLTSPPCILKFLVPRTSTRTASVTVWVSDDELNENKWLSHLAQWSYNCSVLHFAPDREKLFLFSCRSCRRCRWGGNKEKEKNEREKREKKREGEREREKRERKREREVSFFLWGVSGNGEEAAEKQTANEFIGILFSVTRVIY